MKQQEILTNQPEQKKYVFSKLNYLLRNEEVDEVIIMVAFITMDGLYLILNELNDLLERRVKVVIITGLMNNFNKPKVFEFLSRIENLEVRVADVKGYHPKLYLVKTRSGDLAAILGSSNLTNSALRSNFETNIYFEHGNEGLIPAQINDLYRQVYQESQLLRPELIASYRKSYDSAKEQVRHVPQISRQLLLPNLMQKKALAALDLLRREGQTRALVISATGSGKTYLGAFDVRNFGARRFLFVVHRESILNAAITSYCNIFPECNPGKLSGESKALNHDFIFASIQTLQKDEYLSQFPPDWFDYIIIDEAHRTGAVGYQKILAHFQPGFLLGMTATPERSDDFDIYRLFGNNIAYEIRLNEALEDGLVCPFHYFGISELAVNGSYFEDYADFNRINPGDRVRHILHKLEQYGHGGHDKVRGLVFTSRVEEACELSRLFNQHGYRAISLSGAVSDERREAAIRLLANRPVDNRGQPQEYLDYIFSVDIFNEGIDIPCVNQIILLRPTQSAIVFVQQIGRGLRKSPNKDYCVILDFIGNYASSFLIAVALSGKNSYDKEELRSFVSEANSLIPVNATVSFDRITREQIYASINSIQISRKFISQNYLALKQKLNRVPELADFRIHNSIDPKLIFRYQNKSGRILFNNYYELLKTHNDIDTELDNDQLLFLDYITQELLFAARPDEMFVLLSLINGINNEMEIYTHLVNEYGVLFNEQKRVAIRTILTLETSAALQKKYLLNILDSDSNIFRLSDRFSHGLSSPIFRQQVLQILELGLSYFAGYRQIDKYNDFILYNKYSRKELVRLLNVNLSMETSIYGYRIIAGCVPVFITYHKGDATRMSGKYENTFLDTQRIIWYSRPYGKNLSSEVERIINYRQNNLVIMLFLKKSDNEGSEHYYLGNADIYSHEEKMLDNKSVMKFVLQLKVPVADSYFDYFQG